MKNIEILYEDNSVIVVNKPAGLSVQGGKEVKTSLDKILAQIREPAPLLVHRLDKDTSGVLLAAKGREAAALFSRMLSQKTKKLYIAVCAGHPEKEEGVITQELFIHGKMKDSITKYKTIKEGEISISQTHTSAQENTSKTEQSTVKYSVLEMELGTGRMHQIRRHLAMIGNPVIGDDKYGDFSLNRKLKKHGVKRLLLHAARLTISGEINLDVRSPLPECFSVFGVGSSDYFT